MRCLSRPRPPAYRLSAACRYGKGRRGTAVAVGPGAVFTHNAVELNTSPRGTRDGLLRSPSPCRPRESRSRRYRRSQVSRRLRTGQRGSPPTAA